MTADELDRRLAQEVADAELEHAAQQFATVAGMLREGNSSPEVLQTVRRRLQDAAQAWCEARGHADLC